MWPAGDTALCRASCRHLGLAMPDPRWLWSRVHCTRRQPPPRLCGDPSPTGDMCEWHVCFRVCGVCLCGHVTPDSWRRWASHCKLGLRGVPPTHRVFSSAVSVHVRPGNAGQVHCHRRKTLQLVLVWPRPAGACCWFSEQVVHTCPRAQGAPQV